MKPGDHRCTPEYVLEVVREFAPIGLDPCSNEHSTVGAQHSMAPPDDGLAVDWATFMCISEPDSVVWVNPPWSSPKPWACKCADEWSLSGVESLLWLPCYPETATAWTIWQNATRVCFWGRRVHHPVPGETKRNRSMWPTWMAYFGDRVHRFDKVFGAHGVVVPAGDLLRRLCG